MKFLICMFYLLIMFIGKNVSFADNSIKFDDVNNSQLTIVQSDQYNKPKENPAASPWWEHFFKEIISGTVGIIFALFLWKIQKARRTMRE